MHENKYRIKIEQELNELGWIVQPHEDKIRRYIPDVQLAGFGADAWVEFKYVPEPPRTLNHIEHFTYGQEHWLKAVGEAGAGNCFLWLGTKGKVLEGIETTEHYIWHHPELGKTLREMPFELAIKRCMCRSDSVQKICTLFTDRAIRIARPEISNVDDSRKKYFTEHETRRRGIRQGDKYEQ